MAELHMYQQDLPSKDILYYVLQNVLKNWYFFFVTHSNKYSMKFCLMP